MKDTPKILGRKIMLRQIILSVVVILLLPLLLVFLANLSRESPLGYFTFYKNIFADIIKNPVSAMLVSIAIIILTYFVGGRVGKKIIAENNKPYPSAFSGLLIIWFGFYLSCILFETIIYVIKYGLTMDNISHVVLSWLFYGLIPFVAFTLAHSSILSIILSWEFKKAIKKNDTHYNTNSRSMP